MEEAGSGWKMRWARAGGRGDAPDAAVGRAASRGAGGRAERADADGTGERDREGHGARRVAVRWRVPGNVYRAEIFRITLMEVVALRNAPTRVLTWTPRVAQEVRGGAWRRRAS